MRCSSWLQTKNSISPLAFGKGHQMTMLPLILVPPAAKLKSVMSPVTSSQLHSSHATIMAWSQIQEIGEYACVKSDFVFDDLRFAQGLVFCAQASRIPFTKYWVGSSINFW